nr:hypothetical protein SLF14_116 [Shiraia sp. slf14]
MGQRTSKQTSYDPAYAGRPQHHNTAYNGNGGTSYDQSAYEYQARKDARKAQKKRRSRMNGVVAAAAAGAS